MMGFSVTYGMFGAITAIIILVGLAQVPLIPVELSMTNLSIVELRNNPDEPKGISLNVGEFRIHHYMIGIAIIIMTIIGINIIDKKKRKKIITVSTFFLGFGGYLILDQLPNILTGVWDKPVLLS